MHHREIIINNVKRDKRMADFLGYSNIFVSLSSQVLTYNSTSLIYTARARSYDIDWDNEW